MSNGLETVIIKKKSREIQTNKNIKRISIFYFYINRKNFLSQIVLFISCKLTSEQNANEKI